MSDIFYNWGRKRPRFGIRVVRGPKAPNPGSNWLMTTGWRPIIFRSQQAAEAQARTCARHVRSPYVTYYVDRYS